MTPLLLLFLQASAYQAGMKAYSEHRYVDAIPWFEKAAAGGSQALVAEFMLGNACLEAHQEEKASESFATLFQVRADSAAAHLLTAEMMLRAQMTQAAEKQARRALEIDPRIPQAHYLLGEVALAQGAPDQAIGELQKEIQADPDFPMAYYRLGDAYVRKSMWENAVAVLERAIWLNPNHDGPYVLIGKAYLERGDLGDAEGVLRHALQMDPQNQAVVKLLDQVHTRSSPAPAAGRLSEAPSGPAAVQSASAAPSDPEYQRGLASYRRHDYVAAAKSLREALPAMAEGSPQHRETVQLIGRSEYLAGHVEAAIPWLEKARAAGAGGNELFFVLGNSYVQARQIPKGRAAFAELFGVPAGSAAAHLFTAQMLLRLEFEDDAQAELEAALASEARLPEAHYMLGEIAIYHSQIERAAEELNHEIALNPDFAMAYYRLGDAYTRREDWARAIPPLQRSVWLNPTYSGPYILLGKAYLKQADLAEAERMLRRALQMDPRNASAHYLLGRTLIQSGRTEEGKKVLRRWGELRQESGQ
jgi:tetratricopeptide (TPR) repeat protein